MAFIGIPKWIAEALAQNGGEWLGILLIWNIMLTMLFTTMIFNQIKVWDTLERNKKHLGGNLHEK